MSIDKFPKTATVTPVLEIAGLEDVVPFSRLSSFLKLEVLNLITQKNSAP